MLHGESGSDRLARLLACAANDRVVGCRPPLGRRSVHVRVDSTPTSRIGKAGGSTFAQTRSTAGRRVGLLVAVRDLGPLQPVSTGTTGMIGASPAMAITVNDRAVYATVARSASRLEKQKVSRRATPAVAA
jgi:hypothetical protein